MSYTVEKIASNKVKLSFVESAESFDAAVEKAYLKDRSKINVPGFRKGKAPRKLIENMYGEGVFYDDAFELVAQPAYEEAIKAENLQVVDRPQVDVQQIGAGQHVPTVRWFSESRGEPLSRINPTEPDIPGRGVSLPTGGLAALEGIHQALSHRGFFDR